MRYIVSQYNRTNKLHSLIKYALCDNVIPELSVSLNRNCFLMSDHLQSTSQYNTNYRANKQLADLVLIQNPLIRSEPAK